MVLVVRRVKMEEFWFRGMGVNKFCFDVYFEIVIYTFIRFIRISIRFRLMYRLVWKR